MSKPATKEPSGTRVPSALDKVSCLNENIYMYIYIYYPGQESFLGGGGSFDTSGFIETNRMDVFLLFPSFFVVSFYRINFKKNALANNE